MGEFPKRRHSGGARGVEIASTGPGRGGIRAFPRWAVRNAEADEGIPLEAALDELAGDFARVGTVAAFLDLFAERSDALGTDVA